AAVTRMCFPCNRMLRLRVLPDARPWVWLDINWPDHLANQHKPVPPARASRMPLQTLEPQRLYRQIAEQLRVLMTKGEFQPGARLPAERDLAKQMGVSRPSVREALIALEVEGWVEVRTGSGVFVLERGHKKIETRK